MDLFSNLIPLDSKGALTAITAANTETAGYGLTLSPEQALSLCAVYSTALSENRIVEFGAGGVVKLQKTFAGSDFVDASNFSEVLEAMTEAFYFLKREVDPEIRDDKVIAAMLDAFDTQSMGSTELFLSRDVYTLIKYLNKGRRSLKITGDDDYHSVPEEILHENDD